VVFLGETLAIATVCCWTLSIQFFGTASKLVGATSMNIIRLAVAVLLFSTFLFVRDGSIVPIHFPLHAWIYLGLSGVVGFFFGDIFLFKAVVELGPRLATLLHSMAAPAAAIIGWLTLDESYAAMQWFGIVVTLFGVGLVVFEKESVQDVAAPRKINHVSLKGFVFGLAAMLGQACGMVLSKAGMHTETGYLDAFGATQIRAIAAFCCFVLFFTVSHKWRNVGIALRNRKALTYTTIGACIGPFLGVSLALLSLQHLTTGVASTIFALVPIFMIPFAVFLHKERVSPRSITGAFIAVFGVFLLVS